MPYIDIAKLRCPVCGCTTLKLEGSIDTKANQIDSDQSTLTCYNCGEEGNVAYFTNSDHIENAQRVLMANDVPCPNFTDLNQFIADALDLMCTDIYDSKLADCYSRTRADGIAAAYRTIAQDQIKHLINRISVETFAGTLTASPTDIICMQKGIDIQLNGEAVCTIAEDIDQDTETINQNRLEVYGWNAANSDAIDWSHYFEAKE